MLLGRLRNNLYYIEEKLVPVAQETFLQPYNHSTMNKNEDSYNSTACVEERLSHNLEKIKLWHLRLGYIPFNRLDIVFPDLECKDFDQNYLCIVCPLGKQTKKPFHKSSINTTDSFQLVHIDLWGPMKLTTRLKCNIFCTIEDDYSRYTWVIFIKHKSNFLKVFKTFYELAKTQFGKHIKIKRTDNANELSKGKTLDFYKSKGILH